MKDPKKAEIKRVLLGRAVLAQDGRLIALPAGTFMKTPIGIGDGATAVRLLGISRRVRRYETKDGRARVTEAARKAMRNIGRGLILNEQPEAVACLLRYILTRPAVLVFAYENGAPTLTAWTGRGLTGWLSQRRAIRAFERWLPDTMTANDFKPPRETKEERKARREEKKRARAEKKAAKKAAKNAAKDAARKPEEQETPPEKERTDGDTV